MRAEDEAQAFTKLCDTLITTHSDNKALESAVIELEVLHKRHVNAIRREFNAELDRIETSNKEDAALRQQAEINDSKFLESEMDSARRDYERQLALVRENYQRDVKRVQSNYDSLLEDNKHRSGMVTQLQEDHRRELQRLREEQERIAGNKDREIARLNRKLEEDMHQSESALADMDLRRRLAAEDASVLRTKLLDSEVEQQRLIAAHHEEVVRLALQQEAMMQSSKALLNDFQSKVVTLELELSNVRALIFDKGYQDFRAKLRDEAFGNGSSNVQEELEQLRSRKEREVAALESLMNLATATKNAQQKTLQQYHQEIDVEMEKLNAVQQQALQKRDNLIVKLPSGAVVEFKTVTKSATLKDGAGGIDAAAQKKTGAIVDTPKTD